MSSAMRKASKKLVPRSTVSIRRSLGITITVSTAPMSSCNACSACIMRRLPSNANGFVTTATLKAPNSLASEATTGAAPLPVPPPRPAVIKIMSEPSSASIIFSVSSSAALRPTSGLAPAPRPLVSFAPSCSFTGACDSFNACRSVLAVMNSTPSRLARIMRFTALHPPPPTPITLHFIGCISSLKLIRIPASFAVISPPTFSRFAAPPRAGSRGAGEHGFQFGNKIPRALRRGAPRLRATQHESDYSCIFRLRHLLRQISQAFRFRDAHRQMKGLLGKFLEPVQARAAAGKNEPGGNLAVEAGAVQIVTNQRKQFHGARLDDVREHVREDGPWRTVAHTGNLDRTVSLHECGGGTAVASLDSFRFGNWRAQADGEIVREVIAANRNCAGVTHHSAAEDNQFRGAAADIQQAAAKVALVLRQTRFCRSEQFEHRIADEDSGFVRGGDQILRGGNGGSHQMDVDFEPLADHPDRVANAILRVHHEFMRKHVQNLAVFGKGDVARRIHGAADVVALDVSRTLSKGDAAAAVYPAHVGSGHSDQRLFHRHIRNAFGFFDRATDGTHGRIEIDDQALAKPLGLGRAKRQKLHKYAFDFRDQHACFRAADVQPDQVFVFLRQAAAPAMNLFCSRGGRPRSRVRIHDHLPRIL